MSTVIEQMIEKYETNNLIEQKNAIKEVMQELVLCALSRAGFFDEVAFYGGTALRIFYGLDRFSEDLDFTLKIPDDSFQLQNFFPALEKEVQAYGLDVSINLKDKSKETNIASAFLKGNTKEHLMYFYPKGSNYSAIPKNELIKIKFEVDTHPPDFASFETKYRIQPIPYQVTLYDMPSLFAGKLHAVLGRGWSSRVKGRDLYDYVFYLSKNTPVNLQHLIARLVQSGHLEKDREYTLDDIKSMLNLRFESIDYQQAKDDIAPFINDTSCLDIWCADFFKQITDSLIAVADIE